MGLYATNAFANVASGGVPVSIFGSGVDWVAKAITFPVAPLTNAVNLGYCIFN